MLHVLISELGRGTGAALVCAASWTTAIGNNQGALILGQVLGKLLAIGSKGNCGRDVALFVGTCSVYVDYGNFAVLNGFLEFLNADIRKLTSEQSRGEERKNDQRNDFFHE